MGRFLVPLGVFGLLAVFLFIGLSLKPSEIPSPLLDKAAPVFSLPQLHEPDKTFAPAELRGQVWLFNVWASWCVSCRQEHPVLMQLARTGEVPIYGLNYKDAREDGLRWLQQFGNPYVASAYDNAGQVGIDYGVYGVPETYVIDREGVIRHKHIGPISPDVLTNEILPIVRKLKG
ncbi:MAG: DsbE family thiol:disulfide interchange protein [Pseudomonadota bacterium]|mgnify:CR=1 FL=1